MALFCLIALMCALQLPTRAEAQTLHASADFFRDTQGAVVVLRGLNVSGDAKVPPFRPIEDGRLLDAFPDWGVNVARLLFTWEAFEPQAGQYDESYFAYYLGIIEALHARGVWVVVDVHQDAYSRFVMDGCGEGFPEWTITPAIKKHVPDNGKNCSSWGIKLVLDADMHKAWDDFYADVGGVRTRFLAMLKLLGERLASHPAVIGYDMINEPWADEPTQLAPLHEAGAKVLRAADPDAILFLSPQALTSSGQDTKLPRASFDNFAYAPHYYDAGLVTLQLWVGGSLKDPVERMNKQALAWKVPLLVGEFGAPGGASGAGDYLDAFYRELDARFLSSTQWSFVAHYSNERKDGWNVEDYSILDEKRSLRPNYRVRPYPARISGEPGSFAVVTAPDLTLTLSWTHDPALGATRVFAPKKSLFLIDVVAESEDALECAYEYDERHIRCSSALAGPKRVVLRRCKAGETCLKTRAPDPKPSAPDAGAVGSPAMDGAVGAPGRDPSSSDARDGGATPALKKASGCALHGHRSAGFESLLFALSLLLVSRRTSRTAQVGLRAK